MHVRHQEHPKGSLHCSRPEMLKLDDSLGLPRCLGVEGVAFFFSRFFSNLGDIEFVVASIWALPFREHVLRTLISVLILINFCAECMACAMFDSSTPLVS